MSNWTHVAGVIRADYILLSVGGEELDFDKLIGKECLGKSENSVWADANSNPDAYLPLGSEGSLQKSVWINPDDSSVARYTVSIFGDLRDHSSVEDILEWFKGKCKLLEDYCVVRDAVIAVRNEAFGTKTWTYEWKPD